MASALFFYSLSLLTIPLTCQLIFSGLLYLLLLRMLFFQILSWLTFHYSHFNSNVSFPAKANYSQSYCFVFSMALTNIGIILFDVYCLYPHPLLTPWKQKLLSHSHLHPPHPEQPSWNIHGSQAFFDRLTKVSVMISSILYFPLLVLRTRSDMPTAVLTLHREGQRRNKCIRALK